MAVWAALLVGAFGIDHTVSYDATVLPNEAQPAWSCREVENCSMKLEPGRLHIVDGGTKQGQLQFVSFPWRAQAELPHSVEARVKVIACSGPAGVVLLAADGVREIGLTLYPGRVEVHRLGVRAKVNLADDWHAVRIEMQGDDAVIRVDGEVVLDLTGKSTWEAHHGRNLIGFGSLSSPATGEAWWDRVRWSVTHPDVPVWQQAEHHVVFKRTSVYACFPSLFLYDDGTLVTQFGTRSRRSHIDPAGGSMRMVSRDGGVHWEPADGSVPYYNPASMRADGNLAIAGAIGWRYVDEAEGAKWKARGYTVRKVRPGTVAYLSGARSMVRSIQGRTVRPWRPIEVPSGGGMMAYNQAAYLNVGDRVRLVAIYKVDPGRRYSVYVLRTEDDGDHWTCLPLAIGDDRLGYNETALALNADGQVVALMRTAESQEKEQAGFLYAAFSTDKGKTWSRPVNTGIWGYPPHLLRLPDGRLLATYGYRRIPMGIRACLSRDGGRTWDWEHETILRADGFGSGSDLGYPITQLLSDGTLVTMYYFNGVDHVTHICVTRWQSPPQNQATDSAAAPTSQRALFMPNAAFERKQSR